MSPNLHNNLGNIDFNKPVLRWRKLWLIILPKSRRNSSESHWTPWFHWNQLWRTVWPLAYTGISLFKKNRIINTFQIVLECGSIFLTDLFSHILTHSHINKLILCPFCHTSSMDSHRRVFWTFHTNINLFVS